MKFYTNVFQIGNSMLIRGYDNGRHFEDRQEFHPTFYVPTKRKRSKWKTLDGELVEPVKPGTIKDCRAFIDKYSHCLLYTSPSPRDVEESRMPSSA